MKYSARERTFFVYDQIGSDEDNLYGAATIAEGLAKMPGNADITIRVNSPGGSVFELWTMVSLLREKRKSGAKIITFNDGLAASAASVLLLIGDERRGSKESVVMIHLPHSFCFGGAKAMLETADVLQKSGESLAEFYASRLKADDDQVNAWLSNGDTFFDSDQQLLHGFIHAISGSEQWKESTEDRAYASRVRQKLAEHKISISQSRIKDLAEAKGRSTELATAFIGGEKHSNFPQRFAKFFNRDFQDRYETCQGDDRERYRSIVESLGPVHEQEYNKYLALAKNSSCGHVRQLALGVLDTLIR